MNDDSAAVPQIPPPPAPVPAAEDDGAPPREPGFAIVGIGASAGGLDAFTRLLQALPTTTGMAFVLVQHLTAGQPSALAEILGRATSMPVREVQGDTVVVPNHVYVIQPGSSMVLVAGALHVLPRESHGVHRPIDGFFRSLAEDRRHRAIGVVLSGTASDGTLGLEAIKSEGGITFAQDASASHGGMPHSAIASGCVDFVLPPEEIAREIVNIGRHPHASDAPTVGGAAEQAEFARILELLQQATGVDFRHYKHNTLYRRIARRMVFRRLSLLADYVLCLQQTPTEVAALYRDILINVTSFFRDPAAYSYLQEIVFPRLLRGRAATDPVRIWSLGCSTGQEAYSLAIACTEAAAAAGVPVSFQVFATDLNAAGIETARLGVYPKDIAADVSAERLQRFFEECEGGYRIQKRIREACVFSRHNVLVDPPFSRIDLLVCRNLLIYLQPGLQQRILPMLHFALQPGGQLWLGASESLGAYGHLFSVLDSKHKVYGKVVGSGPGGGHLLLPPGGRRGAGDVPVAVRAGAAADLPREADRALLARFAPPGVLVSAALEILQYRGDTSPYLAPAPGKATLGLLKMLRDGLLIGVREAIRRATLEQVPVRETGLHVHGEGGTREVWVEVMPLQDRTGHGAEQAFLVLFGTVPVSTGPGAAVTQPALSTADPDGERLRRELAATRDYLQSVVEQQEIANDELQVANEEVQSANEELQSSNEELETSKEEIQSSNEELATVNDELNDRNLQLHRINDDLLNLIGSVQMAVVMLGPDLRIRRFTPLAEKLFHLVPTDVGRSLAAVRLEVDGLPDLQPLLLSVLTEVAAQEHEVRDRRGRWYSLRLRPYRTLDNRVDGVIVMLVDVDQVKRAQAYTESIVATVHEPLLVLDAALRVRSASRSFYATFALAPAATVGCALADLGDRQWDLPDLAGRLAAVVADGLEFEGFEVAAEFRGLGRRTMVLNARQLQQAEGAAPSILLAIEDRTERKRTAALLRVSEIRFRRLFEAAKDGILILDATTHKITQVNPFLVQLLDYPVAHFLDKELWEIGFLRDQDASRAAMQELLEKGMIRYESLPLRGRDGSLHPVEMVANVYEEDHQLVIQCNIRDISERSRLESLLRGQASELSDLHRRKDEFLAMLSHELRSPLAPIATAVQLLGLQRDHENPIQQEARGIIERQLGQLKHLVDDLLEVSRITTGRVQLRREPVVIGEIVQRALETVRPLLELSRHQFTLEVPAEPIWLYGDAARLEQVVANLLTNAAKFTDEGGQVGLSVVREGDQCVLRVRDTGVGISPLLLPHVFDLFTQGERSLDRSQGGLGIGLALVHRLTELHGGTVEATSVVGQGSEFVVRLPVVEEAAAAVLPAVVAPAVSRPLRVLVVDDNVDTVASFSMLLRVTGHEVRTAFDGPGGLREALEHPPDVVLLDIGLPELNGYEVARRIRSERSLRGVVLVALTGYGQETDRQQALQAGFDHHLVKPPDFAKLEQILAGVARREG